MRPRLGVLAYWPIQYHSPLYQRLAERGKVDLDVFYLSDKGYRPAIDREFGVTVAWDIDLLSGYRSHFMVTGELPVSRARKIRSLLEWLPDHDAVVVNGYSSPWMAMAMSICRVHGIPYLLRASSHPDGISTGVRRQLRRVVTRAVVSASSGGLSMGHLNDQFYRQHHARRIIFAPNSVDNRRFAAPPPVGRGDLLAQWGMKDDKPVVMYCGKLYAGKRPLDIVAALKLLPREVNMLFVGDGVLAGQIRRSLTPGTGTVTGFINQSQLPAYYHAADLLVLPSQTETWGLVINEGMAAGALPVVSDQVGCGADLVSGIGEIFPYGNVPALADALSRALIRSQDPHTRADMRRHVSRYSLERTTEGFEQAALAVSADRR